MFTAREDNGFFIREAEKIGFQYNHQIVLVKDNPLPHFTKTNFRSSFELCFYMSKGKPKTFNFLAQNKMINKFHYLIGRKDTIHPTEKPIKMFRWLIEVSSNKGDLVFDGFLGSGTTAVACKELGRKCIGIEISPEYCKITKQRLSQEVLNF